MITAARLFQSRMSATNVRNVINHECAQRFQASAGCRELTCLNSGQHSSELNYLDRGIAWTVDITLPGHHSSELNCLDSQGCSVASSLKREIKKGIMTKRSLNDVVNPFLISSFWNNPDSGHHIT